MKSGNTKILRSRILEHFPKQAMEEIKKLVYNNRINDINDKVQILMEILDKYDIDYSELGTGTNRTAIFIDGYVFKIALDKWGVRDNEQEFTLSEELQPYVIKVYECNGIIMACEYVVVITREEFAERKSQIKRILADLSNEYLLGDIGTINKNFANWGYRDNQELVALDFAYIYRIIGSELKCDCDVSPLLEYTPDYDKLVCPHCRKRFLFMDVRRRISKDMETEELEMSKARAYQITNKLEKVETDEVNVEELEYESQTFKFNLYDYIMYKDMEEKIAMKNQKMLEEEKVLGTIIDINEEGENPEDELYNELSMLLAMKNGEIPQEAAKIEDASEDDYDVEMSEAEYEAAKQEYEKKNEELNKFITNMKKYDDDSEEYCETAEPDPEDIYEEIMNIKGQSEDEGDETPVLVDTVEDNEPTEVTPTKDVIVDVLPGTNIETYCRTKRIKSAYIKRAMEKPTCEKVKEEPVEVNSVSFQMMLDSEISNIEIEPQNDSEASIKNQICNLLLKYINVKGIDTTNLDLGIDLSIIPAAHQESVDETPKGKDIIIINNKPEADEDIADKIKIGAAVEQEKDDAYESYMQNLITKYGHHSDVEPDEEEQNYPTEEVNGGEELDEELRKMYENH